MGFIPDKNSVALIKKITTLSNIYVEGILSHLATADQPNSEYVLLQFNTFRRFLNALNDNGVNIPIKHTGVKTVVINGKVVLNEGRRSDDVTGEVIRI